MLGTLVDDAIVVGEDTVTRIEQGETPYAAAQGAASRMFLPVLASTLTTIGGMAPLLFETSLQAQFLIPIALSWGLGFATGLLLFLLPAMIGIADDSVVS